MPAHDPLGVREELEDYDALQMHGTMSTRKARQGTKVWPMSRFRNQYRFKPPKDDVAIVRLVPGVYTGFDGKTTPYFEFMEHFNRSIGRRGRGHVCSRVWSGEDDDALSSSGKCISCYDMENGSKSVNRRRLGGFLLIWLDWFYLIPSVDRDDNIRTWDKDGTDDMGVPHKKGDIMYNRVHEETAIKDEGRAKIKKEGYEKVFGCLMHWSMGTNHMHTLSSKFRDLLRDCKCGGNLETQVYECRECGHEFYDLSDGRECKITGYTRKQVNKRVTREHKCKCGNVGFLMPIVVCSKECDEPRPLKLWDVDLEVGSVGEKAQTQIVIQRYHNRELDERVLDLIPRDDKGKVMDILHRVYAADDIDYQAKILKTTNPWKAEDVRKHRRGYDDDKAPDDDGSVGDDGAVDDDLPF